MSGSTPDGTQQRAPITWVDAHCHVHDARIPDGTDGAVASAHAAGVTTLVSVGCDRPTSEAAIAAAAAHPRVFATVGLHPHDAAQGVDSIVDLLDTPGIVAVGEAGLDFYYDHAPRETQRLVFEEQVALANDRQLPLVIHSRDAWEDTFAVLERVGVPERTVFHCFTGGPDEARRALDLGAVLSFSGIVTFAGAPEVQAAAVLCPLDRMMVETDSPYLAPTPHRGKPNRPAWVPHVGQFVADLRGEPVATVAAATTATALAFFGLPPA
jgi:TatD DNase family protein